MTLGEVLARSRWMPQVGDHEIVRDEHGVAHLLIITFVADSAEVGDTLAGSLGFMCPCMAFKEGTDAPALEVAPHVTCLDCATRG